MKSSHTVELTFIALFAAIIAALTLIPLPPIGGVPMTLQTFAVAFCGFLLGRKKGVGAVGLYLFIGALGLPVFSNLQGGFSKLIGPTGGFLYGFLLMAFFCGLGLLFRGRRRWVFGILFGTVGLLLCHLCGILQFMAVMNKTFAQSLWLVTLPYLPKDLASVVLALALAEVVRKRLPFDPAEAPEKNF